MPVLRTFLALMLLMFTTGPAQGLGPWIGTQTHPLKSTFCQIHGCTLKSVTRNTSRTMGWHDGERHTYTTRNGAQFELELRPEGWISTVRLGFPDRTHLSVDAERGPDDLALEALFLSEATGRTFSTAALARCHADAASLNLQNPDAITPIQPLSRWTTPLGRAYVARCSVGFNPSVWAGWMQQ